MATPFRQLLLKALRATVGTVLLGTVVIGSGYAIMKTTVPSGEEMKKRIGTINSEKLAEDNQKNMVIMRAIIENSKLDHPAWDIDWPDEIKKSMAERGR
ncbi:hypothetical protein BASA50_008569 [Batrachochytrium salamandrivorans]|uniref:Uncharacterized protein n=1 Tax=Batrachochytrium salamandrivorans TaxID=1357716 RepID=A0ABQ8F3P0_9FUNG|nr:hypothetical protein BASA62_010282 [Batrachochytrium salamandrivorans]KAH6562299.1 hypothetical protein BASA60_011167 [Batrachochytrium salamandrivorans]KAH6571881.1 hypothetical protein BASA60_006925 [Batrachochytrium salamandrivorans]KAH6591595.1 hypothetical protein BASA50_008569 [Batrachochytrium salamandrivorans]KAH6593781.1 hypothetical protein BASA61_004171 [Batrachochytrium salamandrivorans]